MFSWTSLFLRSPSFNLVQVESRNEADRPDASLANAGSSWNGSNRGAVYFLADASARASGLWKTNGKDQTALVQQQTSSGSVTLDGLYDYQNTLVFLKSELAAGAGGYSLQLWSSQGSPQSTGMVRNFGIKSGQVSDQPDVAQAPYFASAAGRLYASIDGRDSKGRELWTSDLTSGGTRLLRDIDSGGNSSVPNSWIEFEGRIYFSADTGQYGEELWSSDGSSTSIVQDFMPGPQGSYPSGMLVADGSLYFATHDVGTDGVYSSDDHMKWWRLDDFNVGPLLLHDFGPGSGASLIKTQLAYFQGELYGVAQDPTHGVELWKTDDSPTGVSLVMDINPHGDALPWQPTATYDALYFAADDGVHGEELWKTDGTPSGTVMVRDLHLGGGSSGPTSLVAKDGELFFSANDGTGRFLWQSDGTPLGTLRVAGVSDDAMGEDPQELTILASTLYYSASTAANGREPWAARIYSWNAANLPVDLNRDGIVSPLDVLLMINELNNRHFSDPQSSQLPMDRPNLANAFWFDVNADGFATPLDALIVINWINAAGDSSSGEGESAGAVSFEPQTSDAWSAFAAMSPAWSADAGPVSATLRDGGFEDRAPPASLGEPALHLRSSAWAHARDASWAGVAMTATSARRAEFAHARPVLARQAPLSLTREALVDRIVASEDWLDSHPGLSWNPR